MIEASWKTLVTRTFGSTDRNKDEQALHDLSRTVSAGSFHFSLIRRRIIRILRARTLILQLTFKLA